MDTESETETTRIYDKDGRFEGAVISIGENVDAVKFNSARLAVFIYSLFENELQLSIITILQKVLCKVPLRVDYLMCKGQPKECWPYPGVHSVPSSFPCRSFLVFRDVPP